MEQRLASILAADVVGHSCLMGADEATTLLAQNALRSELFDPAMAKHNGRIVKLMGDGTLAEFASVVDAVNCAVEIQAALVDRNANTREDQRLDREAYLAAFGAGFRAIGLSCGGTKWGNDTTADGERQHYWNERLVATSTRLLRADGSVEIWLHHRYIKNQICEIFRNPAGSNKTFDA